MSGYVTLLGAEQVQAAANRMASAADDMQRAASSISESVERLVRALDDHAIRIEAAAASEATTVGPSEDSGVALARYVEGLQR